MEAISPKTNGYGPMGIVSPGSVESPVTIAGSTTPKQDKPEITNTPTLEETKKDVERVVDTFKEMSDVLQTKLVFSVHEENDQIVVKIMDRESDQLIRQFPSEEMLALQDKMKDLTGFLLNENI